MTLDLSETPTSELIKELQTRSLCCCVALIQADDDQETSGERFFLYGNKQTQRGILGTAYDQLVKRINEGLEDDIDGED